MTVGRETAFSLLERLLAGERADVPLHLAMLLEKSSSLANSDDHYRQFLPPEIVSLRLDADTVQEITTAVCKEILHNPDADLIFVVSTTGSPEVTRFAVKLVVNPPRPLTAVEYRQLLGIVGSWLPHKLMDDPAFITPDNKRLLVSLLDELRTSDDLTVRNHAERILKQL